MQSGSRIKRVKAADLKSVKVNIFEKRIRKIKIVGTHEVALRAPACAVWLPACSVCWCTLHATKSSIRQQDRQPIVGRWTRIAYMKTYSKN